MTSHTSRGGTLDYIFALKAQFDAGGYDTAIVALTKGVDHDPRPEIQVLAREGSRGALAYATAAFGFLCLCVTRRPAIILGVMPLANVMAALGGLVSRASAVATHHNPFATHNPIFRRVDSVIGRAGLYDRIFCVSNTVAHSFDGHSSRYRQCLRVIQNGVRPVEAPLESGAKTRERFGIAQGCPMVLMVGRFSAEKNVLGAIEAVADIEGVQLVLAGDGPLKAEVQAFVARRGLQQKVLLLGTVAKPDVAALLHACDVFVQVSFYEGNSLALLEAISAHATIVVSSVPAQVEAVSLPDGTAAAAFCEPASPADIARAIRLAAFDQTLREHLAARVRLLASQFQTEAQMLAAYEAEIAAMRPARPADAMPR